MGLEFLTSCLLVIFDECAILGGCSVGIGSERIDDRVVDRVQWRSVLIILH